MSQLKALTFRGVTTFYSKPPLRRVEKPPDQFWITEQPFLYNERVKGGEPSLCNNERAVVAGIFEQDANIQPKVLSEAKQRLTEAKMRQTLKHEVRNEQPSTQLQAGNKIQLACEQIHEEAVLYMHEKESVQREVLSYNTRFTNRFYETAQETAEREITQMSYQEAYDSLAYKIELSKVDLREKLKKVGLLAHMADELLNLRIEVIQHKINILRQTLARKQGVL